MALADAFVNYEFFYCYLEIANNKYPADTGVLFAQLPKVRTEQIYVNSSIFALFTIFAILFAMFASMFTVFQEV